MGIRLAVDLLEDIDWTLLDVRGDCSSGGLCRGTSSALPKLVRGPGGASVYNNSLTLVSMPQGSCGYKVVSYHKGVNVWFIGCK